MSVTSIRLLQEELAFILSLMEISTLAGVPVPAFENWESDCVALGRSLVVRSLMARGFVTQDGDANYKVQAPLFNMLELASSPTASVRVTRQVGMELPIQFYYYLVHSIVIQHYVSDLAIHGFEFFDDGPSVSRLLAEQNCSFLSGSRTPLEVLGLPRSLVEKVQAAVNTGHVQGAIELLRPHVVDLSVASDLVHSLHAPTLRLAVQTMTAEGSRNSLSLLCGAQQSWIIDVAKHQVSKASSDGLMHIRTVSTVDELEHSIDVLLTP